MQLLEQAFRIGELGLVPIEVAPFEFLHPTAVEVEHGQRNVALRQHHRQALLAIGDVPLARSPARSSSSSSTYSRPACHISYRSYAFSPSSSASPGWRMRNPSFCCGASNGMAERAKWRIRNMSMRTSDVAAALRNHALSVMNVSGLSMNLRKPTSAAPYNAGWSATNGMDTLTCMSDAPKTCDSKRFSSVS